MYEDEQQQQPICIYINKYEEIFSTLVIKMDPTELRYLTISHTYMNFLIVSVIPNNLEKIDLSFNMMYNLGQNIIQSECLVRLELKGNYLVHLGFLKHARLKSLKVSNDKLYKHFCHISSSQSMFILVRRFHQHYRSAKVLKVGCKFLLKSKTFHFEHIYQSR